MKKIFFLAKFLLITLVSFSQENLGIPPSPTVASLVTVEKDSVNSSGRIVHNVSLWNMVMGEYSFPISLSYSSSGVKVEETPSYVGSGWNFSAGGVITRSVIDHPDDLMNTDHGSGILHTNIMNEIENFSNTIETGGYNEGVSSNFFRYNINGDNLETRNDTQPDLFYFNFFNYSGKFLFNKDKAIVSLSNDNFKYSYTLDSVDHSLKTFTIIDAKGIEYLFAEREYSKTHYNSDSQWEFLSSRAKRQRQLNYYSSWHLSRITTPNNLEILFEYDDETLTYQIKNSEMGKICFDQQCEDTNISDTSYYDILNNSAGATTDFIIDSKKIKKITSNFFNIDFTNTQRADLNGGLKLSYLLIRDYNNKIIDRFNFEYTYFLSPNIPSTNNYEYKRLKLDKIEKNFKAFQEFDYYTDFSLPHRKSTEQDFWGYFNDNNATSLVPKVYTTFNGQSPEYHIFPPLNETITYEYGSVDRNVNPSTVHMGMLKKITYKTEGYKEFFYEPNDFTLDIYTSGNNTLKGNGVRVDRIEYFDGNNIENLDYNYISPATGISSGRLSHLPKFATHIPWNFVYSTVNGPTVTNPSFGNSVQFSPNQPIYGTDANGNQYVVGYETCVTYGNATSYYFTPTNNANSYFSMTTRRFSSSQLPLASNINEAIAYEYILVKEGNNGKKLYNFDVLGGLDFQIPSNYDIDKFEKKQSYKTSFWVSDLDGYLYGPPPEVCPIPPAPIGNLMLQQFNLFYQYTNITGESHPFAPKPNWNKYFGQLKSYTYLNEDGFKVFKEEYEHELKGDISNSIIDKKIKTLKYRLFNRPIGYGGWSYNNTNGYSPSTGPTAWIWSFYDIYYNIGLAPSKITRTNYYNNETSNVSKIYDNEFAHGNFLRKTTHENTEGDIISTSYNYPLDLESGNNVYSQMVEKNILYNNIEIVEEVNNNVISAQVNEYSLSGSNIIQNNSYNLETINTSYNYSNAQAQSGVSTGVLNKDSEMVKKIEYTLFDSIGNPLEYQTEDGVYHSIIWGYNKSYPIAQIDGISYNNANTLFSNAVGQTFSDISALSDNDTNDVSEQALRDVLTLLQSTLTSDKVSVKSATFNPLIGITSVIDIRGDITYFEYDNFNRLKNIKDKDGNILSENRYNYKSQN